MNIAIRGAGVVGASVAYHLARKGCDVTVYERASGFGAGSTAKATGGFRAQFDSEINVRLSLLAREKLLRFEEETGVDPGYDARGYLFLACSDEELRALQDAQAVQRACGLSEARMIGAEEAREIHPKIGDARVIGGAFCPTDGFIKPMNILRGYASAAQRLGARFVFDFDGEPDAELIVDARGAWCGAPVTPVRRNVVATVPTDILDASMPMTIWAGDWYHLRVRDGRVLLLWPDDPVIDDEEWLSRVLEMTRARMPCLNDVALGERWSGFYEMSPDGLALLGRIDEKRWVATGSSGHGVMHSPALGRLLAEMIVDGAASIDVSALDPLRFQQ
ncbi:MAG TPA: FAD-dependent oxidoreductase [Thermoanaerobaculia bacterium]|nr:FAD-dependent oxidoreductase [Thermoanaerobaculia bacterium]